MSASSIELSGGFFSSVILDNSLNDFPVFFEKSFDAVAIFVHDSSNYTYNSKKTRVFVMEDNEVQPLKDFDELKDYFESYHQYRYRPLWPSSQQEVSA